MSWLSSGKVLDAIKSMGAIPLFFHSDKNVALEIVKACYKGGARVIEFTHRGENALEVFSYINSELQEQYHDLILGIGSLKDATQTSSYLEAGAQFIVTPVLRRDIAEYCNERDVLWLAGCATPTEVANAYDLGAKMVKLFPASVYGSGLVKAIKAPMPWVEMMATGGVKPSKLEIQNWQKAGVTCLGFGSALLDKEIVEARNFDKLTVRVKEVLSYF